MARSYNGWPASRDKASIGVVDLKLKIGKATYSFPGGVKGGDVHALFTHFLTRYHSQVESLAKSAGDEWGYAFRENRNASNLSCHASGTAIDVNARLHPNGKARTLTANQVKVLRAILATYEGVIKWGGDFSGTKDEMHYEIRGSAAEVRRIAKKIAATGPKKTWTAKTGDTATSVAEKFGLTLAKFRELNLLSSKINDLVVGRAYRIEI